MKRKSNRPAGKKPAPKKEKPKQPLHYLTQLEDTLPPPKTFTEEKWLTALEVIRKLRICERTLYNWCKKRILPYYKFDRTIRFSESEVDKAILRLRCYSTYASQYSQLPV